MLYDELETAIGVLGAMVRQGQRISATEPAHRARAGRGARPRRRARALGARLDGSGHEAPEPRPHDLRAPEGHVRTAGRRSHRRRCRRVPRRDEPGPSADQGGDQRMPAGDRESRHPPADLRRGDGRDDRHHAHGQRDRRGADRPRTARGRCYRPQLRDGPGRDERAPAAPVEARDGADRVHAQRGTAGADGRRRALSAVARGARDGARAVRARVRAVARRRLLRHDARAPRGGRAAAAPAGSGWFRYAAFGGYSPTGGCATRGG